MEDNEKFMMESLPTLIAAEKFLKIWFGEKCGDFDEDCPCCQRWALLEKLIEYPEDKSAI